MSLASLPKPAIDLIFRFLSHPCADMIREDFDTDGFWGCDRCHRAFGRYEKGLWMGRYELTCHECLDRWLDQRQASPELRARALAAMEYLYLDGLRPVHRP